MASVAQASAQTCTPVRPDLVAWWTADGNALDSRSRNNGTLRNGATFAPGLVGQAFSFDGVDDSIDTMAAPSADFNFGASDFTIEAWVRFSATGTSPIIFATPQNLNLAQLRLTTNSHAEFFIRDSNGISIDVIGTTALNDGAWHHLAGVRQGTTGRIFVDGTQQNSLTNAALGMISSPCNFAYIGGNNSSVVCGGIASENLFAGLIDEVSVYRRALSPPEILAIFNTGGAGKCKPTATIAPAGLVGWWAGDGDARDISGSGNNGALQGGAGFAVGQASQAFSFNAGANSGVVVPSNSLLNPSGGVTLEAWVKPSTFPNLGPAIIRRDTNGVGTTQYSLNAGDGITTGVVHCNIGDVERAWPIASRSDWTGRDEGRARSRLCQGSQPASRIGL